MPQGRAKITFDRDHEILSLDGQVSQAVDLTNHYPSISSPASGDLYTRLLNALQEGGHWIAVDPVGSDLPMIAVYDGALLNKPNRPELQAGFVENLVVIGHEPVFVEKAMKKPLVIPPLARYIYGDADAAALRNIGGEGDAGLVDSVGGAYVSGYYAFRIFLRFWKNQPSVPLVRSRCYYYRLQAGVYTPGAGVLAYGVYGACFARNGDQIMREVWVAAAVGGTVASYLYTTDPGGVDSGNTSLGVVAAARTTVSYCGGQALRLVHVLTDAVGGVASLKTNHRNSIYSGGLYQ